MFNMCSCSAVRSQSRSSAERIKRRAAQSFNRGALRASEHQSIKQIARPPHGDGNAQSRTYE